MIILLAVVVALMSGTAGAATAPTPNSLSQQDRDFLIMSHQGNLAEIEAGRAATRKADDQDGGKAGQAVRDLGEHLVVSHMRLDKILQQVARELGVELPDGPSAAQRRQLEEVMALNGREFDRAWISMEIENHRQALILVRKQIESGSDPQVRKVALYAQHVVLDHLKMFRDAQKSLFPSPAATSSPSS
ncbi:DUF4142 domain-containing protein [Streptosporangium sp. NPDC002721]|uniref:DUF4142 domain-containing protein n=1 Tax=Streptosporangium sp. NPDC002721 TaxID=3366188 RepID=UPI0036BB2F53